MIRFRMLLLLIWQWEAVRILCFIPLAASIEGDLTFDMSMINEISSKTPYLCKVSPATPNVHMEDVLNAGGISAILKELSKKDGF